MEKENKLSVFKIKDEYIVRTKSGKYIRFFYKGNELCFYICFYNNEKDVLDTHTAYVERQTKKGYLTDDFLDIKNVFDRIEQEMKKTLCVLKEEIKNVHIPKVEERVFVSTLLKKKEKPKDLFTEQ